MAAKKALFVIFAFLVSSFVNCVDHPDGKSSVSHQQDNLGNYQFGYTVSGIHGEHFHNAQRDALGRVVGSYGLFENDGRHRIVDYVADHQGFRANVRSNEPGIVSSNSASLTVQSPNSGLAVSNSAAPAVQKMNPKPAHNLDFAASYTAVTASDSDAINYGARLKDYQPHSKVTYAQPSDEEQPRRRVPLQRPRLANVPTRNQRRRLHQRLTESPGVETLSSPDETNPLSKQSVPLQRVYLNPGLSNGGALNQPSFSLGNRGIPPVTAPTSFRRGFQTDDDDDDTPIIKYGHRLPDHHFLRWPSDVNSSDLHHAPKTEFHPDGHAPPSMSTIHGGIIRNPYVPSTLPPLNFRPINIQRGPVTAPIPGGPSFPQSDLIVRAVAIPNGIQAVRVDPSTGQVYDSLDYPIYKADVPHRPSSSKDFFNQGYRDNVNLRDIQNYPSDDDQYHRFPQYTGTYSHQTLRPFDGDSSDSNNSSEVIRSHGHNQNIDPPSETRLSRPSARDLALISKIFNGIGNEFHSDDFHSERHSSLHNIKPNHFPVPKIESTIHDRFFRPTTDYPNFRNDFGTRLSDPELENLRRTEVRSSAYGDRRRDFDYPVFEPTNLHKTLEEPETKPEKDEKNS